MISPPVASPRQRLRSPWWQGAGKWDELMAIRGMITGEDVVAHVGLIAREFGIGTLWRGCGAPALRGGTAIFACASPPGPVLPPPKPPPPPPHAGPPGPRPPPLTQRP